MTGNHSIYSRVLPSVCDLIVLGFFLTWILFHSLMQNFDIWFHLRTGELIRSGFFPHVDVFSFTAAGKPWIAHEWGSEVIFSWLYDTFGVVGLITLRALIVSVTVAIFFKLLVCNRINIPLSVLLTIVVADVFRDRFLIRPQLFSFLLFMFVFYIYNEYRTNNRRRLLYLLPPLFILWINLHGGFLVGFILLGLCIAGETLDNLLIHKTFFSSDQSKTNNLFFFSALSFVLCLLNPNTYRGLLYPFLYGSRSSMVLYSIAEWWPASWGHNELFFMLVLFLIGVIALSGAPLKFHRLFPILFFALYTFQYNRIAPYFAVVSIAFTGDLFQDVLKEYYKKFTALFGKRIRTLLEEFSQYLSHRFNVLLQIEKTHRNHLSLFFVLAIIVSVLLSGRLNKALIIGVSWNRFPTGNIKVLKACKPEGNIFNQYRWGGILIHTFPDRKVFIDGRMDVYRQQIATEYDTVLELRPGWRKILDRYNITHILVDKNSTIARFLADIDATWVLVSSDRNSDLFFKKSPGKKQ